MIMLVFDSYESKQIIGEVNMRICNQAVMSLACVGALVSPAFAQGDLGGLPSYTDDLVTMTSPTGTVIQKRMTDRAMMDMMVKEAAPMEAGTVMMMHNGKMYMMKDHKMPNGKMMSEILAGK